MILDVKNAFTFVFEDPHWIKKLLIGGAFFFLVIVLAIAQGSLESILKMQNENPLGVTVSFKILETLVACFMTGFLIFYANNQIHDTQLISKPEATLLPEWNSNYLKFFIKGLIAAAIEIIYSLVTFIVAFAVGLAVFIPFFTSHGAFDLKGNSSVFLQPQILVPFICVLLFAIVISFVSMYAKLCYADSLKFKDAFNVARIFSLLSKTIPEVLFYILISIGIGIVAVLLTILLAITVLGILVLPAYFFYLSLVFYNLIVQIYQKGCEKLKPVIIQ